MGFKAQFAGALANPSTRFVNALVYAAVGIMGALFAVAGTLSVGQLSCFLTYANQYTKPFNEVKAYSRSCRQALRRQDEFLKFLRQITKFPTKYKRA